MEGTESGRMELPSDCCRSISQCAFRSLSLGFSLSLSLAGWVTRRSLCFILMIWGFGHSRSKSQSAVAGDITVPSLTPENQAATSVPSGNTSSVDAWFDWNGGICTGTRKEKEMEGRGREIANSAGWQEDEAETAKSAYRESAKDGLESWRTQRVRDSHMRQM